MNDRKARNLVIIATAVIIGIGLVMFFAAFWMDKVELARGIAAGAGIAVAEFDSTALVLMSLLKSKSKFFWGLLLVSKSLCILALVAALILVLKISGIGFIIGFSGLLLGVSIAGAFSLAGAKEVK